MNSSSVASSSSLSRSRMMVETFSGVAIRYSRSRAMTRMRLSFSSRHSMMVSMYLRATEMSCLAISPRLKSDRYFELASLTETNLVSTFTVYVLSVGFCGIVMKHWKHSKRIALAAFFTFPLLILAQTPSCEVTRISP